MAWVYLTIEQAIEIHRKTVDVSGGGSFGHLDIDKLEAVLQHMQNDEYYPTFDSKLTHLFFCACKFHCFEDGNKRIAITLCAQMLLSNGYLRSIHGFIRDSENISYHVAAGNISKELLGEWIEAVLCGVEDDEALKLKILTAISKGGI
ncbi:type II toxin-antitoxin system death-on-curing family toxin [Candidatus Nitrospira nitrificans]|uniref:Death-on-curing family protein n=1 Tax=Candidatus Nitrospira nitrificans TaxID=1742973 RepID=A0A0S4LKQ3_9BACT|nr:Fic family protein [Candidatus Nitrospira nitrificans]CUS37277.1 Death-on-curing family protein [Candidatus Nitrospira nitrificans]